MAKDTRTSPGHSPLGRSLVEVTRTKGLDLSPRGSQSSAGHTAISPDYGLHWSHSGGRVTVSKSQHLGLSLLERYRNIDSLGLLRETMAGIIQLEATPARTVQEKQLGGCRDDQSELQPYTPRSKSQTPGN